MSGNVYITFLDIDGPVLAAGSEVKRTSAFDLVTRETT